MERLKNIKDKGKLKILSIRLVKDKVAGKYVGKIRD